jgi:hypothetical protein
MAKARNKALELIMQEQEDFEPLSPAVKTEEVLKIAPDKTKSPEVEVKPIERGPQPSLDGGTNFPTPNINPPKNLSDTLKENKPIIREEEPQAAKGIRDIVNSEEKLSVEDSREPQALIENLSGVGDWFKKASENYRDGNFSLHVSLDDKTIKRLDWAENACGFSDQRKSKRLVIAAMAEFFFAHHGKEIEKINEKIMKDTLRKMRG